MKCSIFIATSADGYIATEGGEVDWLKSARASDVDMGDQADMGFTEYLASVDEFCSPETGEGCGGIIAI